MNAHEMRHSFVSLLSDSDIPLENISRLVGHRNTSMPVFDVHSEGQPARRGVVHAAAQCPG
ncbi:hypothetical protein [Streptosporangium sp. NPDC002607]